MQFFSLTKTLKVMFQWHIHDNPVYPQNLLRTKGALGDRKKMALGGISVVFLEWIFRRSTKTTWHFWGFKISRFPIPTCFSFFCSTGDLFAAAKQLRTKITDSRIVQTCHMVWKGSVWWRICANGKKNNVVLWQDCESCWCSVELPDILWW